MPQQMRPLTRTHPFLRGLLVWAEAPHQGLAGSEFRAFDHPPESPLFPNRVLIGNRIELTLLASMLRPSMGWRAVSAPPEPWSAPPPQAPNQDQNWHCTNFSSCEANPTPSLSPLNLKPHDLKKRRVLRPNGQGGTPLSILVEKNSNGGANAEGGRVRILPCLIIGNSNEGVS